MQDFTSRITRISDERSIKFPSIKRTSFSTPSQRSFASITSDALHRGAPGHRPRSLSEAETTPDTAILARNTGNQCALHFRCLVPAN